ncbi:hypothetical protein [Aquimarina algiphila]|uniref:Uncharacterized protein n=1 Tax=Aquimarina algiphila TaxID=2047982 RepID=A0A554VBL7_9FLAO|nr:hypothetical protein [Aquimarina algiphila]TSE03932.1 hypothetical protein FOF46_28115 [Aquimarina algiphila]
MESKGLLKRKSEIDKIESALVINNKTYYGRELRFILYDPDNINTKYYVWYFFDANEDLELIEIKY